MDVASYIREYLFKQDSLDIPGLGTFFLKKEPFTLQKELQVMKPGYKALTFIENASVQNDTLSYFIARRKGVNLEQARDMVSSFLAPISKLYQHPGETVVEGLGTFTVRKGNSLEFSPQSINFSPAHFGLGVLKLQEETINEREAVINEQASSCQDSLQEKGRTKGTESNGTTFISAHSTKNTLPPHISPLFEDVQKPAPQENRTIYWVLGGLIFVGLAALILYMARVALFGNAYKHWPAKEIIGDSTQTDTLHPESLHKQHDTLKKAGIEGAATDTMATRHQQANKQQDPNSQNQTKNLSKVHSVEKSANDTVLALAQCKHFLLIAAHQQKLPTAMSVQHELSLRHNSLNTFIIDMGNKQTWRYALCVGTFDTHVAAKAALILAKKMTPDVYIFKNTAQK